MLEQPFSTSEEFSGYFLENSPFFHLSQENHPNFFFLLLQVNKDKGRGRKTGYCKFGMAGIFAVQGFKHYQTCSVWIQSVNYKINYNFTCLGVFVIMWYSCWAQKNEDLD